MTTTCHKTSGAVLERLEVMQAEIEGQFRQLVALMTAGSSPKPAAFRVATPIEKPTTLTQRQQLILKLIAEGRTNNDIADMLAYSESLIRQETIRIYDVLDCSGRLEAAEMYRKSNTDGKTLGEQSRRS